MKGIWGGLLALLLATPALARDYDEEILVTSPEELYEMLRAGELDEEAVDTLVAMMENPLDLNRADRNLLYDLPEVTYDLADAIITYRSENGPFASVDQLLSVPGMQRDIYDSILPFVTVTPPLDPNAPLGADLRGKARVASIVRDGIWGDDGLVSEVQPGPQEYLKAEATGLRYFGGGFLLTFRERTATWWDSGRDLLVTDGPKNTPDLENVYLTAAYGPATVVAGTYDIGFGERLTFDTSTHRDPRGWYTLNSVYDDNERGLIKPDSGLFGGAVTLSSLSLPFGWVDVTGFASTQKLDLYQYRGVYYLKETGESGCKDPYDWDEQEKRCRSSRVYDEELSADGKAISYIYTTFKDAFRESLAGSNVTLRLDDETQLGVTAYRATTTILLADGQPTQFSLASRYPNRSPFGAVGAFARTMAGPVMLSGEYATTGGDGHAAFVRGIWRLQKRAEVTLALRYYSGSYDNPRGRAEAETDQAFGLSARNEMGARLNAVVNTPLGLRLTWDADVWRRPQEPGFDSAGELYWTNDPSPADLRLRLRAAQRLGTKESVSVTGQFTNKDVSANGPDETYDLGDPDGSGDNIGKGERSKVTFAARSSRIPGLGVLASVGLAWEGGGKGRREREEQYRLRITVRAWEGGQVVSGVSYWAHVVPYKENDDVDRENPQVDCFVDLKQRFFERFTVRARYGLIHFKDDDPRRYDWYQLAKLSLEGSF